MKTYIKPRVVLVEINTANVFMENSMPVGTTPVDGDKALARPHTGIFDLGDNDTDMEDDGELF